MENTKLSKGKVALIIIGCLIALLALSIFIPTDPAPISAIEIKNETINMEIGTSVSQYFIVMATEEFSENDLKFISDDNTVATVEFKEISLTNNVFFTVTGIKEGTTQIYFTSADGSAVSNKIKVTVQGNNVISSNTNPPTDSITTDTSSEKTSENSPTNKNSSATSDKTSNTSTKNPSGISTQKPASSATGTTTDTQTSSSTSTSTTKSETANNNSSSSAGNSVTIPDKEETEGNLVWVPIKGGTKYHRNSDCSGMEEPMQVTKETAIANGYSACKKCYK